MVAVVPVPVEIYQKIPNYMQFTRCTSFCHVSLLGGHVPVQDVKLLEQDDRKGDEAQDDELLGATCSRTGQACSSWPAEILVDYWLAVPLKHTVHPRAAVYSSVLSFPAPRMHVHG